MQKYENYLSLAEPSSNIRMPFIYAKRREEEKAKADGGVSGKTLEISSKIKKIMTSVDVMETLKRLEVEGEPVWGLSSEERELVHDARQKVNEC